MPAKGSLPNRRRRRVWLATLIGLLLAGTGAAFHAGTALIISEDASPPDAIVMLASHEWERLPAAAELARQYPSSLVLLTVPLSVNQWNCQQCAERPKQFEEHGVRRDRIRELSGDPAANTHGEAISVSRYIREHPIKRLLVVTSPYHTRRALHTFAHVLAGQGVEVGVAPASSFSPANPPRWWLGAYDRSYVPYEWAGIFYYRIKYRVPLT